MAKKKTNHLAELVGELAWFDKTTANVRQADTKCKSCKGSGQRLWKKGKCPECKGTGYTKPKRKSKKP